MWGQTTSLNLSFYLYEMGVTCLLFQGHPAAQTMSQM